MIGTRGQEGADTFLTEICTPDWITEECDRQDGVWGYGKLTVTQWDFKIIRTRIERYVASCSGENWREIAQQLSKIGTWEFENYVS